MSAARLPRTPHHVLAMTNTFPFATTLDMSPVVDFWRGHAQDEQSRWNAIAQTVVAKVEGVPELSGPIDDPALNAFAVPGGYIYFHSGTILAASNINELAGVMGHEIAHVRARHYAHRKQDRELPSLLTNLASIAAGIAAREPGLIITGQALNVDGGIEMN